MRVFSNLTEVHIVAALEPSIKVVEGVSARPWHITVLHLL